MCIVQRYALILVAIFTGLASVRGQKGWWMSFGVLALLMSGFGAFVAARQTWLQWYPPEFATCGRDFYGMIEHYSFSRSIPMIFQGSGDCAAVDWTFLGGSIANWSFICFAAFFVVLAALLISAGGMVWLHWPQILLQSVLWQKVLHREMTQLLQQVAQQLPQVFGPRP